MTRAFANSIVPYLGRGKQDEVLREFCERYHADAKADLATCFVARCLDFCAPGGTTALVTPQNWLFLGTYKKLRERLLGSAQWDVVARLGPRAFETIGGEVVNVALLTLTRGQPEVGHAFAGLDASADKTPDDKASALRVKGVVLVGQEGQLGNPDARIVLENVPVGPLLSQLADAFWGQGTGDFPRFGRYFWELGAIDAMWSPVQSTVEFPCDFGGRALLVFWEQGRGTLIRLAEEFRQIEGNSGIRPTRGSEAWGKRGVCVSLMRELLVTRYDGHIFDGNCAAVVPKDENHLPAIWAFCSSCEFTAAVRKIDQKLNVTNHTLLKVPFDLAHWQQVAAEKYPHGLPKPHSDDPTQWFFNGHPKGSEQPLHVAVARLLGYRWPRQTGSSFPDCPALGPDGLEPFADQDGIVCISAIKGEQPAAERLRALLAAAYGSQWSAQQQAELLAQVGGKTLEDWLRHSFFEQHCQLFHQRPFIWHIYDGRKDGFSALINYHQLNRTTLEKLIYTYLGDWLTRQRAAVEAGEEGSDAKLTAALELKANLEKILEGEAPYDIFVRWKPLEEQPIGWAPDLNDGVRLNIRPFVTAGVLRKNPKIHWNKDRGKDVPSAPWFKVFKGERINEHHLRLEEKRK